MNYVPLLPLLSSAVPFTIFFCMMFFIFVRVFIIDSLYEFIVDTYTKKKPRKKSVIILTIVLVVLNFIMYRYYFYGIGIHDYKIGKIGYFYFVNGSIFILISSLILSGAHEYPTKQGRLVLFSVILLLLGMYALSQT